ncbi:histidine protein methyltransferase 1 homolog [Episyrphus balteatus]|uniref:histidine protein methyltransferase 1 homolog n=1 Tax=Episyrphus balteatus TaxID=286459 RepID=UPI002485A279|nr:histidine protein methyltransferase 1 homolog [Episyrphus balteatus]XP_055858958.1 histidine protein methyltransferase 1 homolog [Episyrphus balteatus]XP_055858959.1 histidine protein methyltransferase 1 homolog [Episyrphus balteatus]
MFKFDFKVDNGSEEENIFKDDTKEVVKNTKNETTVECYDSKEIKPPSNINENLDLYKANSMEVNAGDVTLTYIKSGDLLQFFDTNTTKDITKAEESHSDLIPGVYEGGAKIWECTEDLIAYLAINYPTEKIKSKRVLDLGCGSGVLGIYAHNAGALVHFQDYNEDVLEKITIPNVFLNLPEEESTNLDGIKFYSGDWAKYTELTKDDEKFDIILTSETIYNPDNQRKLLDTFDVKLSEKGTILLAAKIYYFGVGGGLRQFEELLKKDKRFQSEIVWSSSEGLSREILEIKRAVL